MLKNRLARTMFYAGAAAATSWAVKSILEESRHARKRSVKQEKKAELHRWEGEGGTIVTPSSALTGAPR